MAQTKQKVHTKNDILCMNIAVVPFVALSTSAKTDIAWETLRKANSNACIFPVASKQPTSNEPWSDHTNKTGKVHGSSKDWKNATGYAIAPLKGSKLLIIDVDEPAFKTTLLNAVPRLAQTYHVHRGPNSHFYIYTHTALGSSSRSIRTEGNKEAASIRSHGAYCVGPYSDHQLRDGTITGDRYLPENQLPIITLNENETHALFALFNKPSSLAHLQKPHSILSKFGNDLQDIDNVTDALKRRKWTKGSGDWIQGRCLFPHNHKCGDRHPSATFNTTSGVYNCFGGGCGRHSLPKVMHALGLRDEEETTWKPRQVVFRGRIDQKNGGKPNEKTHIEVELNTACALRAKNAAAFRTYLAVLHHSRSHNGQHTYTHNAVYEACKDIGLSLRCARYGLSKAIESGLFEETDHGKLKRKSVEKIKAALGLESGRENYASFQLPGSEMTGNVGRLSSAITAATTYFLPKDLANRTRTAAVGLRSKTSLIKHENFRGVKRTTQIKLLGTVADLEKANERGETWNVHFIESRNGERQTFDPQCRSNTQITATYRRDMICFSQLPSHRTPTPHSVGGHILSASF